MNDTPMTVVGNLVEDPRMRLTKSGTPVTNFRIASTPRHFDRDKQSWVDDPTLFLNVACWRNLAENVAASMKKGQPVLVTGRLFAKTYTVNEQTRVSYELDASAVGHDLSRGTTQFAKSLRSVTSAVEIDSAGLPADRSDEWHDLAETGPLSGPLIAPEPLVGSAPAA